MALVVELVQFLLELDPVAEQRDQPFVLDRRARGRPTGRPAAAGSSDRLIRGADRPLAGRESVAALEAIVEPLVQQHVAQPAFAELRRMRERIASRPGWRTQRPQ